MHIIPTVLVKMFWSQSGQITIKIYSRLLIQIVLMLFIFSSTKDYP